MTSGFQQQAFYHQPPHRTVPTTQHGARLSEGDRGVSRPVPKPGLNPSIHRPQHGADQ